jgi:hypothetical protein
MPRSSLGWMAMAVTVLLVPGTPGAQTLYRCGNQYQDTPCEAGKPGKRVSGGAPRAAAAPSAAVDGDCSRRGERALQIIWAREAGATEDQQLAKAGASGEAAGQRHLIQAVYEKRGSAASIRAAIESDCLAEKEKIRQAQAMSAAAAKLMQEVPGQEHGIPAAPSSPASERVATTQSSGAETSASARAAEEMRKRECSRMRDELAALRDQQRRGGNAATMESFRDQRRSLERSLSSAGC